MRSATSMNPYLASRPATLALGKLLFLLLAQIPALTAAAPTTLHGVWAKHIGEGKDSEDPELWLYLTISVVLVLSGGAFAGLTIALMGQVSFLIDNEKRKITYLSFNTGRNLPTSYCIIGRRIREGIRYRRAEASEERKTLGSCDVTTEQCHN